MSRIHELQNTRGKELSGIQITAYFLRIRVQPLQARKNPLSMYAGEKDADRLSTDLSVKDLEKLIRRISSLSKKDPIPSSCRVEPYSSTNALPQVIYFYRLLFRSLFFFSLFTAISSAAVIDTNSCRHFLSCPEPQYCVASSSSSRRWGSRRTDCCHRRQPGYFSP